MCNVRKYNEEARTILAAAGKEHNFTSDVFPGAGHLIDVPFAPVSNKDFHGMVPKPGKLYYGGDDFEMHSAAQEEAWVKTLGFFREHLG